VVDNSKGDGNCGESLFFEGNHKEPFSFPAVVVAVVIGVVVVDDGADTAPPATDRFYCDCGRTLI